MDTKNKIVKVEGLIIGEKDYKEYDKLLTLLTKEYGKLNVYAFGVRKSNSKNIGKARLFSFGSFELKEIKDMYQLDSIASVKCFENLALDFEKTCYASYFIELADYFGYENIESTDVYLLLYYVFKALDDGKIDYKLIKRVFELKMLKYQGLYKEKPSLSTNETLLYTWDFVLKNNARNLFSFKLSNDIYKLFDAEMNLEMREKVNKKFKSLEYI